MKNDTTRLNRVAIIGGARAGAKSIYSLLMSGVVAELVLIDKDDAKLLEEIINLQSAVRLARPFEIRVGDYSDAKDADIVVISAGEETRPGENRLDTLEKNVSIIREIVRKLMSVGFGGIILMTTNPVDVLAKVAQEESDLPAEKVIGSGTVLDANALRQMLRERAEAETSLADADGEYAAAEVASWCAARVCGVPFVEFCQPDCPGFPAMLERLRNTPPETTRHKGYTSFVIGSCVTKICEAILRDERMILPVATMASGQYGIRGVYLNLACVIGRGGVEQIVELPLSESEKKAVSADADLLKQLYSELERKATLSAAI